MHQQTLEDQWSQIKRMIQDKWSEFSDGDFSQTRGSVEELIGLIQERTGEAREQVESYLNSISPDNDFLSKAQETVVRYAAVARDTMDATTREAMDQAKAGYDQTERLVRDKPMESLAVGFGVGLLAGIVGGILLKSK